MKKFMLLLLAIFVGNKSFCQQVPYILPRPEKWGVEKIDFPISFAPKIPYKGNEEIRFIPGWGNAESEEYWSYTFLWFIEGNPQINGKILQDHFTEYFNGLFRTNNKEESVAKDVNFTKAQVKKIETASGDQETYKGKISTLNFLTGKPLELFVIAHVRNYPNSNHSAILFELSPKRYDQVVWRELDGIVRGFKCN